MLRVLRIRGLLLLQLVVRLLLLLLLLLLFVVKGQQRGARNRRAPPEVDQRISPGAQDELVVEGIVTHAGGPVGVASPAHQQRALLLLLRPRFWLVPVREIVVVVVFVDAAASVDVVITAPGVAQVPKLEEAVPAAGYQQVGFVGIIIQVRDAVSVVRIVLRGGAYRCCCCFRRRWFPPIHQRDNVAGRYRHEVGVVGIPGHAGCQVVGLLVGQYRAAVPRRFGASKGNVPLGQGPVGRQGNDVAHRRRRRVGWFFLVVPGVSPPGKIHDSACGRQRRCCSHLRDVVVVVVGVANVVVAVVVVRAVAVVRTVAVAAVVIVVVVVLVVVPIVLVVVVPQGRSVDHLRRDLPQGGRPFLAVLGRRQHQGRIGGTRR
mmetsp:Transcript_14456/g.30032  ORF Transcript_14456/g.30032 Transcript_14456/m.30032 type:complete len:374 (-) Transcript_14456:343-1464(-)